MFRCRSMQTATLLFGGFCIHHAAAQPPAIALGPGLTVRFSIYGGYSSDGALLGDYDYINKVTEVSGGGYRFNFLLTGPAASSGWISVAPPDKKAGTMIREYISGGDMSGKGYVSFLALSDKSYADLKAGRETPLEFDGPESPRGLKPVASVELTSLVDERVAKLPTIKATGKSGGTFWILDNPALPLVVRGETKWKWMVTSIETGAGNHLISDLRDSGSATTHAILFAFNSADIEPDSKPILEELGRYLRSNGAARLEIQGHTDDIGGAAPNLALSEKRAAAVKSFLVGAGIDAARLTARGFGLSVPVADNGTPEGRARNRRVVSRLKLMADR